MHQLSDLILDMTRQSVSFTSPNNDWLQRQVESKEYKNKSEVINDLVRKARQKEEKLALIRTKLQLAEQSNFIEKSQIEILAEIKKDLKLGKKI